MSEEQLFDQTAVVHCLRCNVRLKVASDRNEDARLLRHAAGPVGYCANCAVTEWLKTTEGIGDLIDRPRCQTCGRNPAAKMGEPKCTCEHPKLHSVAEILALPHVQQLVHTIMAVGHADAKPDEIDWLEVAANWSLPLTERKKRKRKR